MSKISGKGTFRGVPFLIEESQNINGGRRLVSHEYPLRNDGLVEDLGKKQRTYDVSCLVIGDDYLAQAEKLINALEADGKGTLNHPYWGKKEVFVENYQCDTSTSALRVARFSITFYPAVSELAPDTAEDTLFGALDKYSKALDDLAEEFAAFCEDIALLLENSTDNGLFRLIDALLNFIESGFQSISRVVGAGKAVRKKLNAIRNRIYALSLEPRALAKEIQALFTLASKPQINKSHIRHKLNNYQLILTAINKTAINQDIKIKNRALLSGSYLIYNDKINSGVNNTANAGENNTSGSTAIDSTTSQGGSNTVNAGTGIKATIGLNIISGVAKTELNRADIAQLATEKRARQAQATPLRTGSRYEVRSVVQAFEQELVLFVQALVLLEYGNAVASALSAPKLNTQAERRAVNSQFELAAKSDVTRYADELNQQLDETALTFADSGFWGSYLAISQYRLALISDLRTRGEALKNSRQITLRESAPALAVMYAQTGNAAGWLQLCERNNVRHPLLVIGGQNLEVIDG